MESYPFLNPVEILQRHALEWPDRLSHMLLGTTEEENQSLTYRQLDAQARRMAAYLQSVAEPGQRALLVYPTSLEFVIAMYACMYAGVIPIPTNPPGLNRSAQRLDAIVRDAQASLVLTTPEYHQALLLQADQFPDLAARTWITRQTIEASGEHAYHPHPITPDAIAFIQYTSGSTNIPKGVVIRYRNLSWNAHAIRQTRRYELSDESVILTWTPLFHDMGLLTGVFQTVIDRTPGLLMSPIQFMQNPLIWLRNIQKYRVTASGGPNFAYELCVRKIPLEKCEGLDLSSWKLAYNSAEPIRAETQEAFAQKFAPFGFRPEAFTPCYGLAEATLEVSAYTNQPRTITLRVKRSDLEEGKITPADPDDEKNSVELVSSGTPLINIQVAIVHPQTGQRCPPDRIGEIWLSGGNIADEYWNRPEDTETTFRAYIADSGEGPFLRTGDLGFLHNGHLYVTGRLKDLVIVRGRNYYPQDIEATVEKVHLALRPGGGAAFSITRNGSEYLVVIQETQLREIEGVDWNEVIKQIRASIAREHGIRASAVILIRRATLAKTSSGKIMRSEMKRRFLANELEIVAEWRAPIL